MTTAQPQAFAGDLTHTDPVLHGSVALVVMSRPTRVDHPPPSGLFTRDLKEPAE